MLCWLWMLAIRFYGLYLKLFERSKTVSFASDNCVSSGYSRVDNYQHSKIKFVSTRGHIISSIYTITEYIFNNYLPKAK